MILPLTIAAIAGAGLFQYFLTGRDPKENLSWLTDFSSVSMKCALIIVFTSAYKQASGVWLTKQDKLENPGRALIDDMKAIIALLVFTYVFLH